MRIVAVVVLLALLTACGGKDADPPKIADVADKIGCEGFEADSGGQAYAREVGACKVGGNDVYVQTYSDTDSQKQWLDAAQAGGGIFVKGELWSAQTFDRATADAIAKAGDGEVQ